MMVGLGVRRNFMLVDETIPPEEADVLSSSVPLSEPERRACSLFE